MANETVGAAVFRDTPFEPYGGLVPCEGRDICMALTGLPRQMVQCARFESFKHNPGDAFYVPDGSFCSCHIGTFRFGPRCDRFQPGTEWDRVSAGVNSALAFVVFARLANLIWLGRRSARLRLNASILTALVTLLGLAMVLWWQVTFAWLSASSTPSDFLNKLPNSAAGLSTSLAVVALAVVTLMWKEVLHAQELNGQVSKKSSSGRRAFSLRHQLVVGFVSVLTFGVTVVFVLRGKVIIVIAFGLLMNFAHFAYFLVVGRRLHATLLELNGVLGSKPNHGATQLATAVRRIQRCIRLCWVYFGLVVTTLACYMSANENTPYSQFQNGIQGLVARWCLPTCTIFLFHVIAEYSLGPLRQQLFKNNAIGANKVKPLQVHSRSMSLLISAKKLDKNEKR